MGKQAAGVGDHAEAAAGGDSRGRGRGKGRDKGRELRCKGWHWWGSDARRLGLHTIQVVLDEGSICLCLLPLQG